MSMEFWLAPWRPSLLFTGRSIYRVQPDTGEAAVALRRLAQTWKCRC